MKTDRVRDMLKRMAERAAINQVPFYGPDGSDSKLWIDHMFPKPAMPGESISIPVDPKLTMEP